MNFTIEEVTAQDRYRCSMISAWNICASSMRGYSISHCSINHTLIKPWFIRAVGIVTDGQIDCELWYLCAFLHCSLDDGSRSIWTFSAPNLTLGKNRSRLVISAMDYDSVSHLKFINDVTSSHFISAWAPYDDVWISTNFIGVGNALRNPRVDSRWLIGRLPLTMREDSFFSPLLFELLFKPTEILTEAVERVLHLSYRKLICVHVRIGRNPSNPYDYVLPHRQNITRTMITFLDKKLREVGANGTRIFVASHSDAAIAEIRQRFLGAVVTVPGPIIHVDQTYSTTEQRRCEGFLKVLTEFVLLGECNVSILSKSGFSLSASRRNMKPDHEVYLHDDAMQSIARAPYSHPRFVWGSPNWFVKRKTLWILSSLLNHRR